MPVSSMTDGATADSAMLAFKLVKNGKPKVYNGAPHGMCTTHKNQINEDLLAFIKAPSLVGV